jgi:hypothetical protein
MMETPRETMSSDRPGSPPIVTAVVVPVRSNGRLWLLVGGVVGAIALVFLTCAGLLVAVPLFISASGPTWQLAGTWVHVDQPPSLAAEALMSVGDEVVSDESYVFSRFGFSRSGSVTRKRYRQGAREPYSKTHGTWRLAPDQDGDEGETTILIEFSDQPTTRVYLRFLDHRNADFRTHFGDSKYYYKPR